MSSNLSRARDYLLAASVEIEDGEPATMERKMNALENCRAAVRALEEALETGEET